MFIVILNPLYDRFSYFNIAMITYSSPWKPSHDAAPEIRMQYNLIFFLGFVSLIIPHMCVNIFIDKVLCLQNTVMRRPR